MFVCYVLLIVLRRLLYFHFVFVILCLLTLCSQCVCFSLLGGKGYILEIDKHLSMRQCLFDIFSTFFLSKLYFLCKYWYWLSCFFAILHLCKVRYHFLSLEIML